jgi:Tfp pilus assembly protein PilV
LPADVRRPYARSKDARRKMRRTLRPLAALAILAVISAGCSKTAAQTSTSSSAANTNAATRQQAAKFAECMRANGVKEFPDPDASGTYTIDGIANGSSLDTHSAAFKQAIAACNDLQPAGFIGHKRTAEEQENALKFAQCIRDNGVKDFPDPTPDGPLVDTNRIPSAAGRGGTSIPGLSQALEKCRDLAANAGVSKGR